MSLTPPTAPGWQRVTPEMRFQPGRLYAVLVPGYPAFLCEWLEDDEGEEQDGGFRGGLVDFPDHHDVWLNREPDRSDAALTARYFFELPQVPPEAEAECRAVWKTYFDQTQARRRT